MTICVGGLAGSGKSTLARKIAGKYGLKYFSGGDALMALAMEEGYSALDRGWWESEEGLRFLVKRGKDPRFDQAVDQKLQTYFQTLGWDNRGIPTAETLKKLDLSDVNQAMEKLR